MEMTVTVPEKLAERIGVLRGELSNILELGIQAYDAKREGFGEIFELVERLAMMPPPEEVLGLRPSEALQARMTELLEKNRAQGLSVHEEQEWKRYEYVEHLVRMAKAEATLELQGKSAA